MTDLMETIASRSLLKSNCDIVRDASHRKRGAAPISLAPGPLSPVAFADMGLTLSPRRLAVASFECCRKEGLESDSYP